MQKSVLRPGMWGEIDSEEIDEPQLSYGVVTHRSASKTVVFSGAIHPEGDIEDQTRGILEKRGRALADIGGSFDDVTTMCIYVRQEHCSEETQVRIHEVRAEFFERPHYPAATMVGVAALLHEDALIEIEIEAEIPDDEWETDVLTGED